MVDTYFVEHGAPPEEPHVPTTPLVQRAAANGILTNAYEGEQEADLILDEAGNVRYFEPAVLADEHHRVGHARSGDRRRDAPEDRDSRRQDCAQG